MNKEKIITIYRLTRSLNETARQTGLSSQKVRRFLINAGEYVSPAAEQIRSMYTSGCTPEEIRKALGLSRSAVFSYLPYRKGEYNAESPTENALRIRRHRQKNP